MPENQDPTAQRIDRIGYDCAMRTASERHSDGSIHCNNRLASPGTCKLTDRHWAVHSFGLPEKYDQGNSGFSISSRRDGGKRGGPGGSAAILAWVGRNLKGETADIRALLLEPGCPIFRSFYHYSSNVSPCRFSAIAGYKIGVAIWVCRQPELPSKRSKNQDSSCLLHKRCLFIGLLVTRCLDSLPLII